MRINLVECQNQVTVSDHLFLIILSFINSFVLILYIFFLYVVSYYVTHDFKKVFALELIENKLVLSYSFIYIILYISTKKKNCKYKY